MRKTIQILLLALIFGCGGSGIEGYVNEPITITANNPEEGQDVDYFWSLAEQPDGSLINSGDLLASDDGQEMVFTPDYPGDYLIEVVISQYGDEISDQTFSFTILDASEKQVTSNNSEEENEDWLNEEIEDSLQEETAEIQESAITVSPEQTEKVDSIEEKPISDIDKIGQAEMSKMAVEKEAKPILNPRDDVKLKQQKGQASIAERTDRFTIQITSKKMLKDAQLFSQDLIGQGYDSYIQKVVFNSEEIWYRVRVGSYDNYNSAKTAADALSSELGMPTWVDFVRKEQ
jgi:cell division septation protein DedD